eukprot:COSAG01_NODE_1513_length_10065_cov_63.160144_5_plen_229_part_00
MPWQRCHPSSPGDRCVRAQRPHELCVEYLAGGAALLRCQLRSRSSTAPQPDDERMQQEEPESTETSEAGLQTVAEEVVRGKSLAEEAAAAVAPVEAAQTGRKRRRLGVIDSDLADNQSTGRCRLRDAVLGIALRGHALRGDAVPAALSPTTSSQPLLNTLITTLRRHALYPRARAAPCDMALDRLLSPSVVGARTSPACWDCPPGPKVPLTGAHHPAGARVRAGTACA